MTDDINELSTDDLLIELQKRTGVTVNMHDAGKPPACNKCGRPMLYSEEKWFCLLCRAIKQYSRQELIDELQSRDGVILELIEPVQKDG